ncbi:hypothetical protein D3C81_1461350 [compost metagenome]
MAAAEIGEPGCEASESDGVVTAGMAANYLLARDIKHLRDLIKVFSFVVDRNFHACGRMFD